MDADSIHREIVWSRRLSTLAQGLEQSHRLAEHSKTATFPEDPYRIGQVGQVWTGSFRNWQLRCLERTCSQCAVKLSGSEYSCGKYCRTQRDTVIQAWSVAPPRGRPSPITQSINTDTQSQRATERKGNFRCHKESGQPATLFGPKKKKPRIVSFMSHPTF